MGLFNDLAQFPVPFDSFQRLERGDEVIGALLKKGDQIVAILCAENEMMWLADQLDAKTEKVAGPIRPIQGGIPIYTSPVFPFHRNDGAFDPEDGPQNKSKSS